MVQENKQTKKSLIIFFFFLNLSIVRMSGHIPRSKQTCEFCLPPTDWSKIHSGGRWITKAERFPSPKEQPFHCYTASAVDSKVPNSGYSFRSRSPRLPVTKPPEGSVVVLRSTLEKASLPASSAFKTTSQRLAPPPKTSAPDVLTYRGPDIWKPSGPGGNSPSYKSRSPRLPETKVTHTAEAPPLMLGTYDPVSMRKGSPSRAAFNSKSPRLPSPARVNENTSATPVVLPNGKSAVCSHSDRAATAGFRSKTPR